MKYYSKYLMGQKGLNKNDFTKGLAEDSFKEEVCFGESPVRVDPGAIGELPHRLLGAILMEDKYGMIGLGTGILISPDLVLTAAHNIFKFSHRQFFKNFRFYLGQFGPLGTYVKVQSYYVPEEFTRKNNVLSDYALLRLSESIGSLDFIQLKSDFSSVGEDEKLAIFGYNGGELKSLDPDNPYQLVLHQYGLRRKKERIQSISQEHGVILHKISTVQGQSGAPIILTDRAGKMSIVGIHKGGVQKRVNQQTEWFNTGRLTNRKLVEQLRKESAKMGAMPFTDASDQRKSIGFIEEKDITDDIEDEQTLLRGGIYCKKEGNLVLALKCFTKAAHKYNNALAYNYVGIIQMERQQNDESINNFLKATTIDPKMQSAFINKGFVLNKLEKYQEAIDCFSKAIEIDPTSDINAYAHMAISLENLGQYEQALAAYKRAVAINPNDSVTLNNMGVTLDSLKRSEEALSCYLKAIALDSKNVSAHYNMGDNFKNLKRSWEAVGCFRRAISINPQYAQAHFGMGDTFIDLEMFEESIECFRKAIEADPNYKTSYNNLAFVYNKLKKYQEAIECCHKAIALDPDYAYSFNHMGAALIGLGKYDEAVEACRKAIALKENYAGGYRNLGVALWKLGKIEEASANLCCSIKLNPTDLQFYSSFIDFSIEAKRQVEAMKFLGELMAEKADCSVILSQAYQKLKKNYYAEQ